MAAAASFAYQLHGLRDLLRDLVGHKDSRKKLLEAAGVSEGDGKRRIPWNSTSVKKHLGPCWSLLLQLGLIPPELKEHVNISTGKVTLTRKASALNRETLDAALDCYMSGSPAQLPSSPLSASSADVLSSECAADSPAHPPSDDLFSSEHDFDSFDFDDDCFDALSTPDALHAFGSDDEYAPFLGLAGDMMTCHLAAKGCDGTFPLTAMPSTAGVPVRSLPSRQGVVDAVAVMAPQCPPSGSSPQYQQQYMSQPGAGGCKREFAETMTQPVMPVDIAGLMWPSKATAVAAAAAPAVALAMRCCTEEECGHEACPPRGSLAGVLAATGGEVTVQLPAGVAAVDDVRLGDLRTRVHDALTRACAAAGVPAPSLHDWCFTAFVSCGGAARLIKLLPSTLYADTTLAQLSSSVLYAEPVISDLFIHVHPGRSCGGAGGAVNGGITVRGSSAGDVDVDVDEQREVGIAHAPASASSSRALKRSRHQQPSPSSQTPTAAVPPQPVAHQSQQSAQPPQHSALYGQIRSDCPSRVPAAPAVSASAAVIVPTSAPAPAPTFTHAPASGSPAVASAQLLSSSSSSSPPSAQVLVSSPASVIALPAGLQAAFAPTAPCSVFARDDQPHLGDTVPSHLLQKSQNVASAAMGGQVAIDDIFSGGVLSSLSSLRRASDQHSVFDGVLSQTQDGFSPTMQQLDGMLLRGGVGSVDSAVHVQPASSLSSQSLGTGDVDDGLTGVNPTQISRDGCQPCGDERTSMTAHTPHEAEVASGSCQSDGDGDNALASVHRSLSWQGAFGEGVRVDAGAGEVLEEVMAMMKKSNEQGALAQSEDGSKPQSHVTSLGWLLWFVARVAHRVRCAVGAGASVAAASGNRRRLLSSTAAADANPADTVDVNNGETVVVLCGGGCASKRGGDAAAFAAQPGTQWSLALPWTTSSAATSPTQQQQRGEKPLVVCAVANGDPLWMFDEVKLLAVAGVVDGSLVRATVEGACAAAVDEDSDAGMRLSTPLLPLGGGDDFVVPSATSTAGLLPCTVPVPVRACSPPTTVPAADNAPALLSVSPSFAELRRLLDTTRPSGLHLSAHAAPDGSLLFEVFASPSTFSLTTPVTLSPTTPTAAAVTSSAAASAAASLLQTSQTVTLQELKDALAGRGVLSSGGHLEYVLLNGCYTASAVVDLAQACGVPYAFGWDSAVSSPSAAVMAACFYKALLNGGTYTAAYEAAKRQVLKFQVDDGRVLPATLVMMTTSPQYAAWCQDKPCWV